MNTPATAGRRRAPADPFLEIKRRVHDALLELLGPSLYDAKMDEAELDSRVRQTLGQVISAQDTMLSTAERQQIQKEISDEILGYGPLEPLLQDPEVTEIMVVGPDRVFVERSGQIHDTNVTFADERHLRRTLDKIVGRVGRRIDESSPMVDARLTDGSRVNAVIAAARARRPDAHDPKVRRRPVRGRRPRRFRHDARRRRCVPRSLRRRAD